MVPDEPNQTHPERGANPGADAQPGRRGHARAGAPRGTRPSHRLRAGSSRRPRNFDWWKSKGPQHFAAPPVAMAGWCLRLH